MVAENCCWFTAVTTALVAMMCHPLYLQWVPSPVFGLPACSTAPNSLANQRAKQAPHCGTQFLRVVMSSLYSTVKPDLTASQESVQVFKSALEFMFKGEITDSCYMSLLTLLHGVTKHYDVCYNANIDVQGGLQLPSQVIFTVPPGKLGTNFTDWPWEGGRWANLESATWKADSPAPPKSQTQVMGRAFDYSFPLCATQGGTFTFFKGEIDATFVTSKQIISILDRWMLRAPVKCLLYFASLCLARKSEQWS